MIYQGKVLLIYLYSRMQRGQLKDISSWMARLLPEPLENFTKSETHKMFGSKTTGSSSTFYTDLEETDNEETILQEFHKNQGSRDSQTASEDGNSQDSDSAVCLEEHQSQQQQQYTSHSFHRIANFGGFPRFQSFLMSTSTPGECTSVERLEESTSIVQMSHSVLEYRSSRWLNSIKFIKSNCQKHFNSIYPKQ